MLLVIDGSNPLYKIFALLIGIVGARYIVPLQGILGKREFYPLQTNAILQ